MGGINLGIVSLCALLSCTPIKSPDPADLIYTTWEKYEENCKEYITFYHGGKIELVSNQEKITGDFSYAESVLHLSKITGNKKIDCAGKKSDYAKSGRLIILIEKNTLYFETPRGFIKFTKSEQP